MSFGKDSTKSIVAIIIDYGCPELSAVLEAAKGIVASRILMRKYDIVGVYSSSNIKTDNHLTESGDYKNVCLDMSFSQVSWKHYDYLDQLQVSEESISLSDSLDPIIVAADYLEVYSRRVKGDDLRIIMFSDFTSLDDEDGLDEVQNFFVSKNVKLDMVLPDDQIIEDGSPADKVRKICRASTGSCLTLSEYSKGLDNYSFYQKRMTRSKSAFRFGAQLSMPILSIVLFSQNYEIKFEKVSDVDGELKNVKIAKVLKIKTDRDDDIEPAEKDCIKAYRFCDKLIPFNEEDMKEVLSSKRDDIPALDFISFVPVTKIDPNLLYGNYSRLILPDGERSAAFLGALANSMSIKNVVALVAYKVIKSAKEKLGILYCNSERNLIMVRYPFLEDIRFYNFDQKIFEVEEGDSYAVPMENFIKSNKIDVKSIYNLHDPLPVVIKKVYMKILNSGDKLKLKDFDEDDRKQLYPIQEADLKVNLSECLSDEELAGAEVAFEPLPKLTKF